jgi:hypothetical protein
MNIVPRANQALGQAATKKTAPTSNENSVHATVQVALEPRKAGTYSRPPDATGSGVGSRNLWR